MHVQHAPGDHGIIDRQCWFIHNHAF